MWSACRRAILLSEWSGQLARLHALIHAVVGERHPLCNLGNRQAIFPMQLEPQFVVRKGGPILGPHPNARESHTFVRAGRDSAHVIVLPLCYYPPVFVTA